LPTPVRDWSVLQGIAPKTAHHLTRRWSPGSEPQSLVTPTLAADITRCEEPQLRTALAVQRETLSALHAAEHKALTANVLQLQAQLRGTRSGSAA